MFILSALVLIFLIDIAIYGISSGDWLTALSGGMPFIIAIVCFIYEKRVNKYYEELRKKDPYIDRVLKEIEKKKRR